MARGEPKGGRPPFEPTPEQRGQVTTLRANGLTVKQIATALEISVTTLEKYFKPELAKAYDKTYAYVVGKLMQNIRKGDRASIFFWLKTRAHWTETHKHEHGGNPDAPPIDIRNMSMDDLVRALAAVNAAEAAEDAAPGA